MTQQRMTISKKEWLPKPLRSRWLSVEKEIRQALASRGISLSAGDLAFLLETWAPQSSQQVLSYALEFFRPFVRGLGLRVARLTDTQIELVLPAREKNLSEEGQLHEGACTAAAVEAFRLLWARHAPLGKITFDFQEILFKKHQVWQGEARLRWELPESVRQKALAELRQQRRTKVEGLLFLDDEKDQRAAEVLLRAEIEWTPALEPAKE